MSSSMCGQYNFLSDGNSTEDEIYIMDSCLSNQLRSQVYLTWLCIFVSQGSFLAFYVVKEYKENGKGLRFYLLIFLFFDALAYIIKEVALITHANQLFHSLGALFSYWMCELAIATLLHKWLKASLDILKFRHPNERVTFQRFIRSFIISFSILFGFVSSFLWIAGYIAYVVTGEKDTYNVLISIGFVWFGVCVYVLALWFIYVIKKLFSVIDEDSGDINPTFSRDKLRYKLLLYTSFEVIILISAGTACFIIVALSTLIGPKASPFYFILFEIGFNCSGFLVISSIFWILFKGSSGNSTNSFNVRSSSTQDAKGNKEIEIIDFNKNQRVSNLAEKDVDDKLDVFLQSVNHSDKE